jgi:ligand-binding sensor domain-containing protein
MKPKSIIHKLDSSGLHRRRPLASYLVELLPGTFFKIILVLTLSFLCVKLDAQHRPVVHYTTADELPTNNIYMCSEDSIGFIWLASENGAVRFDGKNFNLFTVDNGLPDNEVLSISPDSSGRMIARTFTKSAAYYDDIHQRFVSESEDSIWKKKINQKNEIQDMDFNNRSNILYKGDIINQENKQGITTHIATNRGVYILTNEVLTDSIIFTQYIGEQLIQGSYLDNNNNIWITTQNDGVYCVLNLGAKAIDEKNGLPFQGVQSLFMQNDTLIAGGNIGQIAVIYSNRIEKFNLVENASKTIFNKVRKIEIVDQTLYVAHSRGFTQFEWPSMKFKQNDSRNFKDYHLDQLNQYLYKGSSSTFEKSDLKNDNLIFTYPKRVTCIESNDNENIWFGSLDGLYNYSAKSNTVNKFECKDSIINSRIADLKMDQYGILWIATGAHGLLAKVGDDIFDFDEKKGLASNNCRTLFTTGNTIYVGTSKGVSALTYELINNKITIRSVQNYSQAQGIADAVVNQVILYKDKLYMSTSNGISILDQAIEQKNVNIVINNVFVENQKIATSSVYELEWIQDDIRIDFSAICFTCGPNYPAQYAFFRSGEDTIWNSTEERSINLLSIKPGSYTFLVKTQDSKAKKILIKIIAPIWSTWWFWSMIAAVGAIIFFVLWKSRLKRIHNRAAERISMDKKFAQLEMSALRSQMNPHFLYNTMSSLQYVIRTSPTEASEQYVVKISQLMRLLLETSRNEFVSVRKEVDFIQAYIEIENIRFNNKYTWDVQIAEGFNTEIEIPSMLVQPFVENAINHGLRNRTDDKGDLLITIRKVSNFIVISVIDNGIGRKRAAEFKDKNPDHTSRGIEITMERISVLNDKYNLKSKAEIIDGENGTTAIISLEIAE